jgi:hypothetical protein
MNKLVCSFSCKINWNLVTYYGVYIHFMYIMVLCITLKVYHVAFIHGVLNIYLSLFNILKCI